MKVTETTQQYIRALQQTRGIDLDKLFGSAIDVAITNYTNNTAIVERVSIPAEFAEPLLSGLAIALEQTLTRRVEYLQMDLTQAKAVLGKDKL